MEGQGCHSTLITHIEDDLIVHVDTIVQPLYLGWCDAGVAIARQQKVPVRMMLQILLIKIVTAGIGKLQRPLVLAVNVAEVSGVGKDVGPGNG